MFRNLIKPKMSNLKLVNLLKFFSEQPSIPHSSASHLEQLRIFCEGHSVTKETNEGILPLRVALHLAPHPDVLNLFVKNGVDVNKMDGLGRTALHDAAGDGNPSAVRHLLGAGANPNVLDNKNISPCQIALMGIHASDANNSETRQRCIECCSILIDVTSNLNIEWDGDDFSIGTSVLLDAVKNYLDFEMVEKLLEKGAKVPNNSGMPMIPERAIMHMALARSSKEDEYRLIKLLLKHGGNPSECLMTPSNRFLEAPVPPPPLRYLLHAAGNDQELIDILKSFGARIY